MHHRFGLAIAAVALLGGVSAFCIAPGVAVAAERPRIDVMPFGGFRLGGDFEDAASGDDVDISDAAAFGIALRLRATPENEWELFYSRQETDSEASASAPSIDVDVEYLHIGGTYFPGDYDWAPYALGGLGVTRLSPGPGGLDANTRFSLSVGAGFRMPLTESFALRLEGRGYVTFVDMDSAVFCRSSGGGACAVVASGGTFIQYEGVLGFAFSF